MTISLFIYLLINLSTYLRIYLVKRLLTVLIDSCPKIRYTVRHQRTEGGDYGMTQRTKKIVSFALTLAVAAAVVIPATALAQSDDPFGVGTVEDSDLALGSGGGDLRVTVANLINVVLGFLGILAVIIVLIGGFQYMLSGGNEEKTAGARKMIVSGIIGLAIILSAWAITTFVVGQLIEATGD